MANSLKTHHSSGDKQARLLKELRRVKLEKLKRRIQREQENLTESDSGDNSTSDSSSSAESEAPPAKKQKKISKIDAITSDDQSDAEDVSDESDTSIVATAGKKSTSAKKKTSSTKKHEKVADSSDHSDDDNDDNEDDSSNDDDDDNEEEVIKQRKSNVTVSPAKRVKQRSALQVSHLDASKLPADPMQNVHAGDTQRKESKSNKNKRKSMDPSANPQHQRQVYKDNKYELGDLFTHNGVQYEVTHRGEDVPVVKKSSNYAVDQEHVSRDHISTCRNVEQHRLGNKKAAYVGALLHTGVKPFFMVRTIHNRIYDPLKEKPSKDGQGTIYEKYERMAAASNGWNVRKLPKDTDDSHEQYRIIIAHHVPNASRPQRSSAKAKSTDPKSADDAETAKKPRRKTPASAPASASAKNDAIPSEYRIAARSNDAIAMFCDAVIKERLDSKANSCDSFLAQLKADNEFLSTEDNISSYWVRWRKNLMDAKSDKKLDCHILAGLVQMVSATHPLLYQMIQKKVKSAPKNAATTTTTTTSVAPFNGANLTQNHHLLYPKLNVTDVSKNRNNDDDDDGDVLMIDKPSEKKHAVLINSTLPESDPIDDFSSQPVLTQLTQRDTPKSPLAVDATTSKSITTPQSARVNKPMPVSITPRKSPIVQQQPRTSPAPRASPIKPAATTELDDIDDLFG